MSETLSGFTSSNVFRFLFSKEGCLRLFILLFCIVLTSIYSYEQGSADKCLFQNAGNCSYIKFLGILGIISILIQTGIAYVMDNQITGVPLISDIAPIHLTFANALILFFHFVGFCLFCNKWSQSYSLNLRDADNARAIIVFTFFTMFSIGILTVIYYLKHKGAKGLYLSGNDDAYAGIETENIR